MTEQQFSPGLQAIRSGSIQQIYTAHLAEGGERDQVSTVHMRLKVVRLDSKLPSLNRSRQIQPTHDVQAAQGASEKPRTADRDISSLRAPRELPQRGTQSNPTVAYRIDQTQVRFPPESIPQRRDKDSSTVQIAFDSPRGITSVEFSSILFLY
jgi:hypothetical protein